MTQDIDHWTRVADDWITWARSPGHDAFWAYRSSLLDFIGQGTGRALDVGCGEGRISRAIKQCGYQVTAVDPVQRFIDAARDENSADEYVKSPAAKMPFDTGAFDLVVAYNVLMDVEDVPAVVAEMARVLAPGGTMVLSIVHPFVDGGRFDGEDSGAPFIHDGEYFGRTYFTDEFTSDGLTMQFAGWSQPLENYVAALEAARLAITALREPKPEAGCAWTGADRWRRIPLFLWMKARHLAP